MGIKSISLLLSCLSFLFIGVTSFGQDSTSSSQLIDDLLSDSDVCVSIGYISKENVSKERKAILTEVETLKVALTASLARQQELELNLAQAKRDGTGSTSGSSNNNYLEIENQLLKDELKGLLEASNLSSSVIDQLTYLRTQVQACASEKQELTAKIDSISVDYTKNEKDLRDKLSEALAKVRNLENELGKARGTVATLQASNKKSDDLGGAITSYKKTVQRLLNEKKCKAGVVDGLIGTQTIQAANRFAYASNFPQKSNLVYDEAFFNHLKSSNLECKLSGGYAVIPESQSKRGKFNYSDSAICVFATSNGKWEADYRLRIWVDEASRRGLTCGVSR